MSVYNADESETHGPENGHKGSTHENHRTSILKDPLGTSIKGGITSGLLR